MAYIAKTPLHLALWDAGGEVEVEAVITYTVTKFRPATMIDPEEPAMAEVSNFQLRKPKTGEWLTCPAWISEAFDVDDEFMNWLISDANDADEYAKECAAEARLEARLEAARYDD